MNTNIDKYDMEGLPLDSQSINNEVEKLLECIFWVKTMMLNHLNRDMLVVRMMI